MLAGALWLIRCLIDLVISYLVVMLTCFIVVTVLWLAFYCLLFV